MIINAEILLCKLNIVSSIYRDFPIWILFRRQRNRPEGCGGSLGAGRKESDLFVVAVVVDEAAVGDTLENWECYTRMKGVELII